MLIFGKVKGVQKWCQSFRPPCSLYSVADADSKLRRRDQSSVVVAGDCTELLLRISSEPRQHRFPVDRATDRFVLYAVKRDVSVPSFAIGDN